MSVSVYITVILDFKCKCLKCE